MRRALQHGPSAPPPPAAAGLRPGRGGWGRGVPAGRGRQRRGPPDLSPRCPRGPPSAAPLVRLQVGPGVRRGRADLVEGASSLGLLPFPVAGPAREHRRRGTLTSYLSSALDFAVTFPIFLFSLAK